MFERENFCTNYHHVPTSMVQQPFGGWYLYCGCQEERCGNVQFENVAAAERWAESFAIYGVQPCLGAS